MARCDFLKHLQTFGSEFNLQAGGPRRIPAWSSKAGDESGSNRICGIHENNWDGFCRRQRGRDIGRVHRHDHVGPPRGEFGCCLVYLFNSVAEQSALDYEVLALNVAEPCEGCLHDKAPSLGLWFAGYLSGVEITEPPHPVGLLRARRRRPRRRAAEQRDEHAPGAHSITSSARASNVSGTVMSSDFA